MMWWVGIALLAVSLLANALVLLAHIRRNRRQATALMGRRFPALYLFYAAAELATLALILSVYVTGLWSAWTLAWLYVAGIGWAHATERQLATNRASVRHWRTPEGQAALETIRDEAVAAARAVVRHVEGANGESRAR